MSLLVAANKLKSPLSTFCKIGLTDTTSIWRYLKAEDLREEMIECDENMSNIIQSFKKAISFKPLIFFPIIFFGRNIKESKLFKCMENI